MIARAKNEHLPVTADVSAHQLHLTEMDVDGFDARCHVPGGGEGGTEVGERRGASGIEVQGLLVQVDRCLEFAALRQQETQVVEQCRIVAIFIEQFTVGALRILGVSGQMSLDGGVGPCRSICVGL